MPSTVTFDTNTLASVVSPQTAQRDTGVSGAAVRTAIEAGHIQGFFSETSSPWRGLRKRIAWMLSAKLGSSPGRRRMARTRSHLPLASSTSEMNWMRDFPNELDRRSDLACVGCGHPLDLGAFMPRRKFARFSCLPEGWQPSYAAWTVSTD